MKKIAFVDFWQNFKYENDGIFGKLLSENFKFKIEQDNPDILFYSIFGKRHQDPMYNNCVKVCYTGENLNCFNYNVNDLLKKGHYIMGMERCNHPRYIRLINIVRADFYGYNVNAINDFSKLPLKTKFCAFIYSNCKVKYRNDFVRKLSKYKHIDCAGKCLNNTGFIVGNQEHSGNVEFLTPYKFNIAFENKSDEGYCTEKIWWGFLSKTISLYWGDPTVYQDFNKGSFLNRHDFNSDEEFINKIIELDKNDELYYDMITKPKIKDPTILDTQRIINFLKGIFA